VGDLDRAWSAAIAAWVRSTLDPAATAQLRVDLDRVVEQALIPERARSNPAREGADQVGDTARRVVAREGELEVTCPWAANCRFLAAEAR
jgi:hypothetical protein